MTLNIAFDTTFFWNLNWGLGSYAFWFAEASGLSATFGVYPIIIVLASLFPDWADLNKDGSIGLEERELFGLTYPTNQEVKEINVLAAEEARRSLERPLMS